MSETQVRTQVVSRPLALAELKTTRWVASQTLVKTALAALRPRYLALRQVALLGWFIVFYETMVVWWWSFIHHLPWPQLLLSLLHRADAALVHFLDFAQRKMEWWWDATGVRLMRVRESAVAAGDRAITTLDHYLFRLQDLLLALATLLARPLTALYGRLAVPHRPKTQTVRRRSAGQEDMAMTRRPGADRESDMADDDYDTEDLADDYLSDTSTDSRRFLTSGAQGALYNRQCTTATAEGRLRAAMYHRVKKELRLMRKNSIRFSCGIVNYAKQVMGPTVQPYAVSFQDYFIKWAKEYEVPEMMTSLQEEWRSDKRPLGKALGLARALCVVYLAFLLRLVKGKKSRRTRSMRSESLRRRAQSLACTTTPLQPLSPSALQQSSEPMPSPPLGVPGNLPGAALREEEDEDLDGSLAKDSALGSELDNPSSDHQESDHAIPTIAEERESDSEPLHHSLPHPEQTTTNTTMIPKEKRYFQEIATTTASIKPNMKQYFQDTMTATASISLNEKQYVQDTTITSIRPNEKHYLQDSKSQRPNETQYQETSTATTTITSCLRDGEGDASLRTANKKEVTIVSPPSHRNHKTSRRRNSLDVIRSQLGE